MGKSKKRSRERDDDHDDLRKKIVRLEKMFTDFIEKQSTPGGSQSIPDDAPKIEDGPASLSVAEDRPMTPPLTDKPVSPESVLECSVTELPLDEEVENVLGVNPSEDNKKSVELHQSLCNRWPTWLAEGLTKETKDLVLDKYPRKGNVHLEAPELNEEVLATLNESGAKRDKMFVIEQNLVGSALSAVGESITMILKDDEEPVNRLSLLENLADTGKLLSQLHYQISMARKSFISPVLSKKMKDLLTKTRPGLYLYGEKLSEKIKAVKSIEKIGKEMKSSPVQPSTSTNKTAFKTKRPPLRPLNWRGPHAQQGQLHVGQKTPQKFPRANQNFRMPSNQARTVHQDRK